jgi:hypothetical protein
MQVGWRRVAATACLNYLEGEPKRMTPCMHSATLCLGNSSAICSRGTSGQVHPPLTVPYSMIQHVRAGACVEGMVGAGLRPRHDAPKKMRGPCLMGCEPLARGYTPPPRHLGVPQYIVPHGLAAATHTSCYESEPE